MNPDDGGVIDAGGILVALGDVGCARNDDSDCGCPGPCEVEERECGCVPDIE